MEFYYFEVDNVYLKQPLCSLFSKKVSKKWVEKLFVNPLKNIDFTVFHFHEIDQQLFHIVWIKEGIEEVFNCFYDAKEQIFFFEKEEMLKGIIKQTIIWDALFEVEPLSAKHNLLTKEDILSLL